MILITLCPAAAVLCGEELESNLQLPLRLLLHFFQGSKFLKCASQELLESLKMQTVVEIISSPPSVYLL